MAKGKKTGGRNFEPGDNTRQSQPRIASVFKDARALNKFEFERILNKYIYMGASEIGNAILNPDLPMVELIVGKVLVESYKYGDIKRFEFILDRILGKPKFQEDPDVVRTIEPVDIKSFEEFCVVSGYPRPYPKQVEMMNFVIDEEEPRILLGAPGYGKTDYCVILGVAYTIYKNYMEGLHKNIETADTTLLMTKSQERNKAICNEVAEALEKNGVPLEQNNSRSIRVEGLQGKEDSLSSLTVKAVSLRGRHPLRAIMEDVVTEDDTSEATRALAEKKYSELIKRTKNIAIVGQPAHAFDLYAKLRPLLKKMEVSHGQIPELDHDLEALKLAGVDLDSLEMSYHLRIPSTGATIFANLKYIDKLPAGETIGFIDPSEGGDYTALTLFRGMGASVACEGYVWKKAWYHCLDDMVEIFKKRMTRRICYETNKNGEQPVDQLRQLFAKLGLPIGVTGKYSDINKHALIKVAGSYSHLIHLSKESSQLYTDQVVKYEYNSKYDDAPDSLARGLEWIGFIRGRK
jgi:hypothetical protein